METSIENPEGIEDTDLFPVWNFLTQSDYNVSSSDPTQTSIDPMELETFPTSRDSSFSPIFHELTDHDQFFSVYAGGDGKGPVAAPLPNLDYHTPEGPVDEIQEILLHSAGLSALRPTYEMLGIEADVPAHSVPKHGPWKSLPANLELQLVQIYFETMHTLCPVLEELPFYQWYQVRDRKKNNNINPLSNLILRVVLFSAFAHIDLDQLEKSPYSSVPEGQKALFEQVHELYNSLRDSRQGSVELAQCACILSHWSPYDSSREVNYFWADEALRHALLGGLHLSMRPYDRIIWWCSLQRNRTLTLALRRPHKLKQYRPGRLPTVGDFGNLSALNPDVKHARLYAAHLAISLCNLSVIMNEIVLLRHNSSRWDDWRDRGDDTGSMEPIIDRIVGIDRSLNEWTAAFERTVSKFDETRIHRRTRVSSHLLRMMVHGTRASMYEQYIEKMKGGSSLQWLLNNVAVNKLKDTSSAVVCEMRKLLDNSQPQDVPLNLAAWSMTPIYVFLAQVKSPNRIHSSGAAASLEIMLRPFSPMVERFVGVRHTTGVIASIGKAYDKVIQGWDGTDHEALEVELLILGRRILREGLAFGVTVQS